MLPPKDCHDIIQYRQLISVSHGVIQLSNENQTSNMGASDATGSLDLDLLLFCMVYKPKLACVVVFLSTLPFIYQVLCLAL